MKLISLSLHIAAFTVMSVPSFAGGVWLSVTDPKASSDPAAKGALVTVRAFLPGGHWLEGDTITGAAEGLVNSQRVSIPLTMRELSASGFYGVWWEPPKEGIWVLNFSAHEPARLGFAFDPAPFTFDVVPVRSGKVAPQVSKYLYLPEIDTILRALQRD